MNDFTKPKWIKVSGTQHVEDMHVLRVPRRFWEFWKPKFDETLYIKTNKGIYMLEKKDG